MSARVAIVQQRVSSSGQQACFCRYPRAIRALAILLALAAVAWDYAAEVPALQNISALFCRRLAHHTRPTRAEEMCCPLPVSLPAQRPSRNRCCESPAPSPDALPSAKRSRTCSATCCLCALPFALPLRVIEPSAQPHRNNWYERQVFDLKMDMRI